MKPIILKSKILIILLLGLTIKGFGQLPELGFSIDQNTAIAMIDPQKDFLSLQGATWSVEGESVIENNNIENMEAKFILDEEQNIQVFDSPNYYYKPDHGWRLEGALGNLRHDINMFESGDQLNMKGFEVSGTHWLSRYNKYIDRDNLNPNIKIPLFTKRKKSP